MKGSRSRDQRTTEISIFRTNNKEKTRKANIDMKRYMAYLFKMEHADQAKFGLILSSLKSQYSLGHNQYPKHKLMFFPIKRL